MSQAPPPHPARPRATSLAVTAAAAGFLVFLELARTMRSFLWVGFQLQDLPPILVAWALYGAAVGALAVALAMTVPKRLRGEHCAGVLPFLSAAACWGVLAAGTGQLDRGGTAIGLATLCAAGLVLLLLTRKDPALILPVAVSAVMACVLGVVAAAAVHRCFLFQPQVRPYSAWVAFGVLAVIWLTLAATLKAKAPIRPAAGVVTVVMAVIGAGLLLPKSALHAAAGTKPNLLLITSDTLRADLCSAFGGPVSTPNMARVARDGAAFDQSYSLAPWTLPSMLGLLSSSYPPSPSPDRSIAERREEIGRYRFPDGTKTLAELCKSQGYATGAFVANTLLDDPNGLLRGFDTSIVVGHRTHVQTGFFQILPLLQQVLRTPFPSLVRPRPVDTTRLLTFYVSQFMARTNEPWLVWVHYMDPHTAYDPPDKYRTLEGPWPVFCNADPYWGDRDVDERGMVQLEPQYRDYVQGLYHGEIRYVDDALGDLLATLSETRAKDRTYLCFTSDHGEEFWEHGNYGHGHALFDELIHVPLIVAGPGVAFQRVVEPFSAIHALPTLAGLLRLPGDPSWRGLDVSDALRAGYAPEPAPVFAQATHPSLTDEPWQCVRSGDWKLVRGMASSLSRLFNLQNDPDETEDLGPTAPEPLARLTELLDAWAGSFPSTISKSSADTAPDARQQDLVERLQDIGYL